MVDHFFRPHVDPLAGELAFSPQEQVEFLSNHFFNHHHHERIIPLERKLQHG
ncbi:hypothetical protein [Paenibacillus sp. IHBB 3054]|uniref:hypothetical protein n=1 Tax=Paenibacillus sp. IHBB 3054 TaxID=3425689 RepID=UPI003F67487C